MKTVGVAIIGCGGITLQNHLPGLRLCPEARLAALCDVDPAVLDRARQQTGISNCAGDFNAVVERPEVDAVIIATPNVWHAPIALAAARAGKHIFCEKPLAMNLAEAKQMRAAAEAAGIRHMTAFTYRFVPAMRFMRHLVREGFVGKPYHYRSCRLQDWDARDVGWRQIARMAGSGELGDMLSHRIDYAHTLMGPIARLTGGLKRFHDLRGGQPSDLEDWAALLCDFQSGATGVLESSKVATGRGESARSQDYVEVNGSDGTLVYQMEQPRQLLAARAGEKELRGRSVPREFWTWPGSPRDPDEGDPLFNFRYDQMVEFIHAILEGRSCRPSFADGVRAQAVMEAAQHSAQQRKWLEVEGIDAPVS